MKRIHIEAEGAYCLFRISTSARQKLEKHLYRRYPEREWGTFFKFGFRRTRWGLALSFVDALWPKAGDLDWQSAITSFNAQYTLRAFREAGVREVAIGVVHSHPKGFATQPSTLDDDMDGYFAKEMSAYSGGFPYCSLIFAQDSRGVFRFSGRVFDKGRWLEVRELLDAGSSINRTLSDRFYDPNLHKIEEGESSTERLRSVFGEKARLRIRAASVGVVGCSGTGSPAIHVLARAGVGEFVIVDPQKLSRSNLERVHGSKNSDFATETGVPFKVHAMRELIKSINPDTRVTALVGNVLHENVFDELLRMDLILGCSDSQHARLFLSDVAKHYLLPVIDCGVAMEGEGGRLTTQLAEITHYTPDLPCALCDGRIDSYELATELMSGQEMLERQQAAAQAVARGEVPDQYWKGGTPQIHTVGYLTSMVGSLMAGYAEGWLTGAFYAPHSRLQFDLGQKRFGFSDVLRIQRPTCNCIKTIGLGDCGRKYRNVARPKHWTTKAIQLFREERDIERLGSADRREQSGADVRHIQTSSPILREGLVLKRVGC